MVQVVLHCLCDTDYKARDSEGLLPFLIMIFLCLHVPTLLVDQIYFHAKALLFKLLVPLPQDDNDSK